MILKPNYFQSLGIRVGREDFTTFKVKEKKGGRMAAIGKDHQDMDRRGGGKEEEGRKERGIQR